MKAFRAGCVRLASKSVDQQPDSGSSSHFGPLLVALPIERSQTGLPIGVQIVGPHLEDRTTIGFAALIEREFGGFVPPPGYAG
jgi:Asp-tRNA(Asn)/Glu-tRNA(Gln) amidotransferase A subunit family amidase